MTQEEQDEADALNKQQQDADLDTADEDQEETIEDVKARLAAAEAQNAQMAADKAKSDEIANNQRIRAEKAERAKGQPEAKKATPKAGDTSTEDLYALMNSKVPQEDIGDVKEYASLKGISVAEALKSNVVKTILADKQESRNVADATNVGTVRRGSSKVSDDTLLQNANKGQMPDDPSTLAEARMKQRKAAIKR